MSADPAPDLSLPRNTPEVEAAFAAVPEERVAEILDGELFTFSRPARPQTRSASRLTMKPGGTFDLGDNSPGGWVILDEPELHLGSRPDKLAPDQGPSSATWTSPGAQQSLSSAVLTDPGALGACHGASARRHPPHFTG